MYPNSRIEFSTQNSKMNSNERYAGVNYLIAFALQFYLQKLKRYPTSDYIADYKEKGRDRELSISPGEIVQI